jgi:hypothetical protein
VESLSPIFGAAPSPTYVQSSHDVSWKTDGDITRLSLFYGKKDGCIKGVKATYGADAANTHRLGIKSQDLQEHSLRLQPGERFVNADYATSSRCAWLRGGGSGVTAVGSGCAGTPSMTSAPHAGEHARADAAIPAPPLACLLQLH